MIMAGGKKPYTPPTFAALAALGEAVNLVAFRRWLIRNKGADTPRTVRRGSRKWTEPPESALLRAIKRFLADEGHGGRLEDETYIDPETMREMRSPNGTKRRRIDDWLKRYLDKGHITTRQYSAGDELARAAQGRHAQDPLSAVSALGTVVDSMASDDPLAAAYDRRIAFHRLIAHVPAESRAVVELVCVEGKAVPAAGRRYVSDMALLRAGLDALAAALDAEG